MFFNACRTRSGHQTPAQFALADFRLALADVRPAVAADVRPGAGTSVWSSTT